MDVDHCSPCESGCITCTGPTSCQQCNSSLYLWNSHCYQNCPESTVMFNNKCYTCPDNCLTCSSASNCTQCIEPYTMWGGQCISNCPLGYYMDPAQSNCQPCNVTCLSCVGIALASCTACKEGYYLNNGTCLLNCPVGTYPIASRICIPCPVGC